jgi:hypothetical protein
LLVVNVAVVEPVIGRLDHGLRRRSGRYAADRRRHDRRLRWDERGLEAGVLAGDGGGRRPAEGVVVRLVDLATVLKTFLFVASEIS